MGTLNSGKFMRIFRPSMRMYFIVLIIFVAATIAAGVFRFNIWILIGGELVFIILLLLYSRWRLRKGQREMLSYVETVLFNRDAASADTLMNMPLPTVIFNARDGKIIWTNDQFLKITGDRQHFFEIGISEMVPNFSTKWLTDGHDMCPETVTLKGSNYRVYGNLVRAGEEGVRNYIGVMYWIDITDLETIKNTYFATRPVMGIIMLDNYDELFRNATDTVKSSLLANLDNKIDEWTSGVGGYLSKYDRDRYIFIFEERYLPKFIEDKFSILDSVREITAPSGVPATISIGIGKDAKTFEECFQYATLSIEMALSRGGDQAVIKNSLNFEFYGGRSMAVERRTKVKSRVMANAMGELIMDASQIIIMGHSYADLDCIGAAAGLNCIARKRGTPISCVYNEKTCVADVMVKKLQKLPEYEGFFISAEEAILKADSKTVLIIVDTNRPEQVESRDLLESCNRVALVDHHRRAADYVTTSTLNFHEPFASSTCELVSELLQYLVEPSDLLKLEAEALMAGIVLDTKNFSISTGSRTFEAAAFLRRSGSDTTEVKRLFQNDLAGTIAKYRIIQSAKIYKDCVAISVLNSHEDRTIAAQASDDLLTINGITVSFVIYLGEDSVNISARSIDDANVQLILEELGGGGNKNMAGAQIKNSNIESVLRDLIAAIDKHLTKSDSNGG